MTLDERNSSASSSESRHRRSTALAWLVAAAALLAAAVHPPTRQAYGEPDASGANKLWPWDAPSQQVPHADDEDDERELPIAADRLFVPRWRLAGGPQVKAAFRDVVRGVAASTVCVHADGEHVAYGAIVAADGWVVTKASQLRGHVTCLLHHADSLSTAPPNEGGDEPADAAADERPATLVAYDRQLDLALLKIEGSGLPVLDLSHEAIPAVGSFLATVGNGQDPAAVGVVSVGPRPVRAQPGMLGVELREVEGAPFVDLVFPGSAADKAGLLKDDRIVSLDGVETNNRDQLIRIIRSYNAGDPVHLTVERAGKPLNIEASLGSGFLGYTKARNEVQNRMGGRLSARRFGWANALQHDTVLRPSDCGGPVVDLDGHVIGLNIARAGRTESYALPTAAVKVAIARLRAESLAASTQVHDGAPTTR